MKDHSENRTENRTNNCKNQSQNRTTNQTTNEHKHPNQYTKGADDEGGKNSARKLRPQQPLSLCAERRPA